MMCPPEVRPSLDGLGKVSAQELVLATFPKGARRVSDVVRSLRPYLDAAEATTTIEDQVEAGALAATGKKLVPTTEGRTSRLLAAGLRAKLNLDQVRDMLLPVAALNLPLEPSAIRRFSRADNLRGAAIVTLYGLPLEPRSATLSAAREHLIAKLLRARFPELGMVATTGKAKLDPFTVALLRTVAEVEKGNLTMVVNLLACRPLPIEGHSAEALRVGLVRAALEPLARPLATTAGPIPAKTDFAGRVLEIVATRTTPPFEDRLAISDLYDRYGREFDDAGSLSTFKVRLLDAHKEGEILLRRLDYLGSADPETMERSEVERDGHRYHFVGRD